MSDTHKNDEIGIKSEQNSTKLTVRGDQAERRV